MVLYSVNEDELFHLGDVQQSIFSSPSERNFSTSMSSGSLSSAALRAPVFDPAFNNGDDYSNDISTTGVLTVGGSVTGNLETEFDSDWFRIDLVGGEEIRFTGDRGPLCCITIYDASGTLLETDFFFSDDFKYTPADTGVYFIGVEGDTISTGEYTLFAETIQEDVPGDTSSTQTISLDETIRGRIEVGLDQDWFSFNANAGETAAFSLSSNAFSDIDIAIYSESGDLLFDETQDYSLEGIKEIFFDATQSGTYFISVSGDEFITPDTAYQLTFLDITDDFAADTTTTGQLAIGGSVEASHELGNDIDWFEFSATLGQALTFSLSSSAPFSQNIEFYDANGNIVGTQAELNVPIDRAVLFQAEQTGTYYISVGPAGMPAGFSYALSLEEGGDDYAGSVETTGAISLGANVSGNIEFDSDRDWFAFSAGAEDIYRFAINYSDPNAFVTAIYDHLGNQVVGDVFEFSPEGAVSVFQATQAGTYYLEISSQFSQPSSTAYQITATEIEDDFAGSSATSGSIASNNNISGVLQSGTDADWFAFSSNGNVPMFFDLSVEEISVVFDLNIYDDNGTLLSPSGIAESQYYFEPPTSGNYFVEVTSSGGISNVDGVSYQLTRRDIVDEVSGDVNTRGVANPGELVRGSIGTTADTDWYAFSVTEGEIFTFSYQSLGEQILDFEVYDDTGAFQLVLTGDILESLVTGTLFIGVSSASDLTRPGDYAFALSTEDKPSAVLTDVSDTIFGSQSGDTIYALNGNDIIDGLGGNDIVLGGFGNDQLLGSGGFDRLLGEEGDDTLFGGDQADNLLGGVGDDILHGEDGRDRLFGGSGNDQLFGGDARDVFFGELGNDFLSGGAGDDLLIGNAGFDTIEGGSGNDRLIGAFNIDYLYGGTGNDRLLGGEGNDEHYGGDGDDFFLGGNGNDLILGDAGNDEIIGNAGFDIINGGAGDDILSGNFNADTFVFADGFGVDIITDFDALNGAEKINLRDVSNIVDFDDLLAEHIDTSTGVVRIIDGDNSITLTGVNVSDLDASDFLF